MDFVKLLPALFAIVGIATCLCVALSYGIDGGIFTSGLIAMAGLGGYQINRASKQ